MSITCSWKGSGEDRDNLIIVRKLILDMQNYPMGKQKEMLVERLGSWMGSAPQTDDILVIGFKIE